MSRARQIARQQCRAFSVLRDTLPATVAIGGEDYDVALITTAATHEQDLGVRLSPESIVYWLPKCAHPDEPTLRGAVVYDGSTYYLDDIAGRGAMHQHWRCRAVRHIAR